MNIVIEGYSPDLDSTLPGVLTNCAGFIPSLKGFEGAPTPQSLGIDALAAACQGASGLIKLDDSLRLFAGTATKLYELAATSWTDRTRVSGGDYGLAADARWSFAQFGNVSLAANKSDILQASSSGAFANIASDTPKASIVETVGNFVLIFDVNDQGSLGGYGDSQDRWWCCAKGDYTSWTPAVATECATGRLTSSAGPLKAAKRFGDAIIAYKQRSMFFGAYVGPPIVWDFTEVPGYAGALSQAVVVNIGTPDNPQHLFMGSDNFYAYDGSRPVPVGNPVRETVFAELNKSYAHLCAALHDEMKGRVYFFYPSSGNTTPDKCVVYNYKKERWGRDDRTIEMPMQYQSAGISYNDLGTYYATYNDLPNIAYDSPFWNARTRTPAIFDTSHTLKSLTAPSVSSSMTLGDFGDENASSCLSRVTPRFLTKPTAANMINYYRTTSGGDLGRFPGETLTQDQTTAMDSKGRFDVMREAFWHRARFDFTGPVELSSLSPSFLEGGEE